LRYWTSIIANWVALPGHGAVPRGSAHARAQFGTALGREPEEADCPRQVHAANRHLPACHSKLGEIREENKNYPRFAASAACAATLTVTDER